MATVVITGANRGIGLEIARIFKARGDDVVAVVRTSSPELDALDVRVEAGVDMTDDTLGGLAERLGDLSIDVLLNNAGLLRIKGLKDLDLDGIRAQFEVNTLGPLKVTAALRDNLAEGGKVVHITSRMGSITDNTSGGAYGYRVSKSAVNSAMRSAAMDLKPDNFTVVVMHPGWVQTDMGGTNALIDIPTSITGMLKVIDRVGPEETGSFWEWNDKQIGW